VPQPLFVFPVLQKVVRLRPLGREIDAWLDAQIRGEVSRAATGRANNQEVWQDARSVHGSTPASHRQSRAGIPALPGRPDFVQAACTFPPSLKVPPDSLWGVTGATLVYFSNTQRTLEPYPGANGVCC